MYNTNELELSRLKQELYLKNEQLKLKDQESKQNQKLLKEKESEAKRYQYQLKIKEFELQEIKEKTYEEIEKSGHVYILDCDGGKKVGRTNQDSVDKRKQGLQTANVNKIKTLFDCETSNSELLEKSVHYVLDRYRMNSNREFFDCDVEYMKLVIEILNISIDTMKSTYRTITKDELYNRYHNKLELIKEKYKIEEYENKHDENLLKYRDKIVSILRNSFVYGEEYDFVKLKDIKKILKDNNFIIDIITLTHIIKSVFEEVEFCERKMISLLAYKNIFWKLKFII